MQWFDVTTAINNLPCLSVVWSIVGVYSITVKRGSCTMIFHLHTLITPPGMIKAIQSGTTVVLYCQKTDRV